MRQEDRHRSDPEVGVLVGDRKCVGRQVDRETVRVGVQAPAILLTASVIGKCVNVKPRRPWFASTRFAELREVDGVSIALQVPRNVMTPDLILIEPPHLL